MTPSDATGPDPSRRRLGRRLRRAALVLAVLVAIPIVGFVVLWSGADTSNIGRLDFEQRLRIPPLLEPIEDAAGHKAFALELREGTTELLPGVRTATWGFNGSYLGPTLRAARGDTVQMRVTNHLPETSTVHWHGMHLPAHADGGPHQTIAPGQTWTPSWTIDQPAASLWYHPTRTARPKSTSTAGWPACSSSTTRGRAGSRCRTPTGSTTSP